MLKQLEMAHWMLKDIIKLMMLWWMQRWGMVMILNF